MKTKRQPTAAQREAAKARRATMSTLAARVSAMSDAERAALVPLGIATIQGRTLSMHNSALIIMQRSTASIVGGFAQWREAGRAVRKGEKALSCWYPCQTKTTDAATGNPETRPGFRLGSVFDISQTDAIPL